MARANWVLALLAALMVAGARGAADSELAGALTADLEAVCSGTPALTVCALYALCKAGKAKGDLCNPIVLLGSSCLEADTGAANTTAGCETYQQLCGSGSQLPECTQYKPIVGLVSADAATAAMGDLCYSHDMPQCVQCGYESAPCATPATSLAAACKQMPGMSECTAWQEMCTPQFSASFASLC